MNTTHYDIVILGGGCAGMQLMHQLIHHDQYNGESILIIDADKAYLQHKSWCFWHSSEPNTYDSIIHSTWNKLSIGFSSGIKKELIKPYRYSFIKSETFFDFHFEEINQYQQVKYSNDAAIAIKKGETDFFIETNNEIITTPALYSSYWNKEKVLNDPSIFLQQQFYGWEIFTEQPVFDSTAAILMDFGITQAYGVNFAYVLPYNKHNALIEITGFSAEEYSVEFFEEVLRQYIQKMWNCTFKIVKIEHASIPMTNYSFNRFTEEGAIAIGTAAGMVKPTTGYAFNRIARDSVLLANHYFNKEIPAEFSHNRFKFYDRLLLEIIKQRPAKALHILMQLFRKVPYRQILRFLDEDSSLIQEAVLFAKLPKKDFIKQVLKNGE
ncbi:lycopene cyclase family protein [Sediminibacterium sp.]|uniref:lycopene cyclase family protein n=1 Tax=Sediminibacterium sp. TaxID=1917865 RepID=UPI003F6F469F